MREDVMRRYRACSVIALLLVGCAGAKEPPPDTLYFVDSKIFDDQFHDTLAHGYPVVVVKFRGNDATVNQVPERIDKWLYIVSKQDDGEVEVLPDPDYPAEKGFAIGLAITVAVQAYRYIEKELYYRPVKKYNAIVYYVPQEGTLTRVVLTRKPEDAT